MEIIAGFVCGYAMALLSTAAFTYLLVKAENPWFVRQILYEETPMGLAAVPLSFGTALFWNFFGLVIGSVYRVLDAGGHPNALGSPSGPFLAGTVVIAVLPLPFLILVWPRYWWIYTGMSAAFVAMFGWTMPLLAER
ncbi:MAG: hypothetical protein AB7T37_13210 [Dehalococcoidia bacterium]